MMNELLCKKVTWHFTIIFFIVSFLLCLFYIGASTSELVQTVLKIIATVVLSVTGFVIVFKNSKSENSLVNPINIFSIIWLILVPLTSFEAPLMEEMSVRQWLYVLVAIVCFCIGGLLSILLYRGKKQIYSKQIWRMNKRSYVFCMLVIIIGVLLYFIQAKLAGGWPIFSANPDDARRHFFVRGLAMISNFPIVAIFYIFCDSFYRKKKLFIFLAGVFVVLQILIVVRFLLFLLFVMLVAVYGENFKVKDQVRKILKIVLPCVFGFLIVANVRGGVEDKQRVFVDSNIYSGSVETLVQTEILRYFGMSQRVMEEYITHYEPAVTPMMHTLFPFLNFLGMEPELPFHYGIYGYTACNIVTYFYFDAGYLWWLLMIFWSFVMNCLYFRYKRNSSNIMNKYLWSVAVISLVMSFFCYVNTFPYWYCHYIFFLIFLNQLNIKRG